MTGTHPAKVARADVVPSVRQGGRVHPLLTPRSVATTAGFLGTLTLDPGEHVAEHRHPYSEEYVYLVRGRLTVRLDGEDVPLGPDESILVPVDVPHRFECVGQEQAFAVFAIGPLAPRPELGHVDLEPVPNPGAPVPAVGGPR